MVDHRAAGMAPCPRAHSLGPGRLGVPPTSRAASPTLKTIYVLPAGPPRQRGRRGGWPVGAAGSSRVAKQLPARLGVERSTLKTLMIGLGTLVLLALTRPALAQRCLSFRAPAFFAGAAVAPGYPYPAYGYPCTHTRFPRRRASASAGAASTGTCSSGGTRASPATPSPAAIAGSRRALAPATRPSPPRSISVRWKADGIEILLRTLMAISRSSTPHDDQAARDHR